MYHKNMLPLHLSFSCGPPEFKPIMDNNHITARYIKDLAYCSVGSHSGTFQKSTHSRALTGSMLCIKCVTHRKVSSDPSDSRPQCCCCHVVVLVSFFFFFF